MTETVTGFAVVDKPGGMTSHDVVARMRRLAGTRKVGHGGTLDPMATGVLVVAVGRITRLLTYVTGCDKSYEATIRLGEATVTDDAEGDVTATADVSGVTDEAVHAGLATMRGEISQVPSAVSAVKIDGKRAYKRVREGEQVELPARRVTVSRLDVTAVRRDAGLEVDVRLDCSSGTYVRAIARDLGDLLGVGGHLTSLRRTRVGGFGIDEAATLEELAERDVPVTHTVHETVSRLMPIRRVTAEEAVLVGHGGRLPASGLAERYAVVGPDETVLAVMSERGASARPEVVLAPA
ncbi:tRNA pseudouridine synthase B [Stackebrandtia albiflava]|uniref:tRNA pseudouridine synthase B n=1 Tax=Stackebrandtia albiflava TaxID=406432 RepID=A0A562VH28_9ACTN|nr:tRNA pseudouridine(55) synthase TruB [Stackebrandtia albiflava]TWJ17170.1 tRNA pseudouridine synthase B [Stackebrandtia albiflava]